MRKLVKVLLLTFVLTLLALARLEAFDSKSYPYIDFVKLENILVVYVNQDILIDQGELRVCFLGKAEQHQGVSVSELFTKSCPSKDKSGQLVVALLNIARGQWIFFYVEPKEGAE